jgi:nucleoside permease NupC
MQVLWDIGGMAILLAIAFLLSNGHRTISLRAVIGALAVQVAQPGIRAVIAASPANLMTGAIAGMLV